MFHVKHFLYLQTCLFMLSYKKGGDNMYEIMTMINTLGVPTVVTIACMWYVKYREDKNDERIYTLNESHKQEMTDITEALNNNTIALQRICDTFDKEKRGD